MSTVDSDMESLLEAFIYETSTLLDQLDEIMLDSEKNHTLSNDNINEIFRIMHTIKGSSAMMGLDEISNLAHSVEDVFFIIREDPSKLQMVSDAVFELVFQSSDFLKYEISALQGERYTPSDPEGLISQLATQASIMKGERAEKTKKEVKAVVGTHKKEDCSGAVQIRVFFSDGSQMENIRAFALMTQLKPFCSFLDSDPSHPEKDSSLCESIVQNGFMIFCKPLNSIDQVTGVLDHAVSIKSYEILTKEQSEKSKKQESPEKANTEKANTQKGKSESKQGKGITGKQSLVSVNQNKLDHLMDLVGELVTAESMVASNPDLKGLQLDRFTKSIRELRKLTDELQDVVMSIRMVPLSGNFQKMNRIVRDMSRKLNKEVDFVTVGGETEVDKTINDAIVDPFMHMVRNAMDHAIESSEERIAAGKPKVGKITMTAKNMAGEIWIDITDDGRGLDIKQILAKAKRNNILTKNENEYSEHEIYHMIMLPGFSTNEQVTEYSGRGVGMDVVRKNVESVGGHISIQSKKGIGTTFTIKIPLTLAIVDGMDIDVGETRFTMPITSIRQSFKVTDPHQVIYNTDGSEMIMIRGKCLPIIRLHSIFDIHTEITDITEGILIQVESGSTGACILADRLVGEQQVVVKPFPAYLNKYDLKEKGLSGCAILGDGTISLILDAGSLLNRER